MVYCVGLTGTIGSGKTTVADIFATLGITILNADKISKELTLKGTEAYKEIIAHYGKGIVTEDQELNRRTLRELIFSDVNERVWLEQLLHPLIRKQITHQISLCTTPYCLIEIPLLTQVEHYPYLNTILLITAPLEIQISRVMKRDQCTKEHALSIVSSQPSLEQQTRLANDIIVNDSSVTQLSQTINQLHKKYMTSAKSYG